jgi:hypothetical protein
MATETSEAVEGGELLPGVVDHPPSALLNLFGSDDPDVVVAQAAKVARALEQVIRSQKLYVTIRGKDHVRVEDWTLLGTMLGVFPITVWTRRLEDGWEARVEARTLDGRLVGAAESMCSRSESRWRDAADYAVRSMAATRATSKALRQPLGFVMPLAGFDATPLEELPPETPAAEPAREPDRGKIPPEHRPSHAQVEELNTALKKLRELAPNVDWPAIAREAAGVPAWTYVTRTMAERVLRTLRSHLAELEYPDTR